MSALRTNAVLVGVSVCLSVAPCTSIACGEGALRVVQKHMQRCRQTDRQTDSLQPMLPGAGLQGLLCGQVECPDLCDGAAAALSVSPCQQSLCVAQRWHKHICRGWRLQPATQAGFPALRPNVVLVGYLSVSPHQHTSYAGGALRVEQRHMQGLRPQPATQAPRL